MSERQSQSDNELAVLARTDQDAFGVLVERYSPKLMRYARRLTRLSDDDLYDVLQNTFLKAYRGLAGYNPELSFSSWMYRIAHNESISFLRKHKHALRQVSVEADELVVQKLTEDTNVIQEAESKHNQAKIIELMDALPEKYRTILVLYYFEDANYETISDIMQLPPGTVATRLRRAKKKLAEVLAEYRHDL